MSAWWAYIYPTIVGRFKPTDSNKKHPYSSGLDYAILTTDGVETHFSTEEKSEPIRLSPEGIKLEIEMLKSYMGKLETVRMLLLEENQK